VRDPSCSTRSSFSVCRWIAADEKTELTRFVEAHRGDIARDLDNDPVFLAQHEFSLNYEAERWKDDQLHGGQGLPGARRCGRDVL
jgi:peptide subunit release factor RF-3